MKIMTISIIITKHFTCKIIMKVRQIKKQFNKVAKKAIKENAFLKKFGLYDTFLFNLKLEKYHLNTTTKEDIAECGNIKEYVNMLVEDIEDIYYNYNFIKGVF